MSNQASNQLIDKTELWTQEELLALWPRSGSLRGQDDTQTGPNSLGATGLQIDSRLVEAGDLFVPFIGTMGTARRSQFYCGRFRSGCERTFLCATTPDDQPRHRGA